ncbi:MAG TPA: hypothetical protein VJ850_14610 [Candidatus Limnocylindrales bacterium]|nr:hypothetical protein [Candidatus Limnocylindrales bacterium]
MTAAPVESIRDIEAAIAEIAFRMVDDPIDGATIPAADAARLAAQAGAASTSDLALLALPVARQLSNPQISSYRVAAVGIEAETGDLLLGGNLEFPGTELATTVHAEGFVALRARRRGHTIATLALPSAHPCAHCRQVLSESAAADGLLLIDTEGNRLRLDDLYPWPFRPSALGMDGDVAGRVAWSSLHVVGDVPADAPVDLLLDAGSRAHAPYSGAPSAAVLLACDGRVVSAWAMESVAFNPSISALQAALVELVAAGIAPSDIREGWLGCAAGGRIDPEPGFRLLLGAVAPEARVGAVRWST